jgi:hypothetical protein
MQLHDIASVGVGAGIGQIEAQIATSTLLAWGLITKVYSDADVEAEARACAHRLAAGPTVAYRYSKALINTAVSNLMAAARQIYWR